MVLDKECLLPAAKEPSLAVARKADDGFLFS